MQREYSRNVVRNIPHHKNSLNTNSKCIKLILKPFIHMGTHKQKTHKISSKQFQEIKQAPKAGRRIVVDAPN